MTRNHSLITQKYYTAEDITASSICTVLHIIIDLIQKWFIYALCLRFLTFTFECAIRD